MSWTNLKTAIESVIKTNHEQEITGESLQNVLMAIVNSLGANATFAGVAIPSTNPGTPDGPVVYIASAGTYPNFGGTAINKNQIGLFQYNGTWIYDVLDCGVSMEYEEYPGGDAFELTFYDSENLDGLTIKIAKTVSGLSNDPNVAISQWWAAQTERKINVLGGYTISIPSLTTSPQTLGAFEVIQIGQIIDSITGANKLIFGTDGGGSVTVNASDLPYKADANLVNVRTESGTANNVSIVVRGINDILPAYININEIANHPSEYASAAEALADVPTKYRHLGVKVVYLDSEQSYWIEMLCVDNSGVNWWTDVENNWIIEGPIETHIPTATGGQQLRIAGQRRGNLDDLLNVNVWNNKTTSYDDAASARAAVPLIKRKLGLSITYLLYVDENTETWVNEQFIGDNNLSDNWTDASNWKTLSPVSVSQNTSTKVKTLDIGGNQSTLFNQQCFTPNSGYIKASDGTIGESSTFNCSDFIKVTEGDVIFISGYGGNDTVGVVVAYDINKAFVSCLLAGAGAGIPFSNELVTIPSGVNFIRVTIANNTSAYYVADDIHFAIKNAKYTDELYGYSFNGIATPQTVADVKPMVFYVAFESGTYNNFGTSFDLPKGTFAIIKYNGSWSVDITSLSDYTGEQLVFCVSGVLKTDGIIANATNFDVTPLIPVEQGDILLLELYSGYIGGSNATCVGIDASGNESVLIEGFNAQTKTASLVIPSGIKFIMVCGANSTHQNYKKRFASIIRKNIHANKHGSVINDFRSGYYVSANDGVVNLYEIFQTTDMLPVTEGDVIFYSGFAGNAVVAAVYGYDSDGNAVAPLLKGGYDGFRYLNAEVAVPSGVSFVRICAGTSSHPKYVPLSVSIQSNYNQLVFDKEYNLLLKDVNSGRFWTTDGSLKVGEYRVYNAPHLSSVQIATEQNTQSVIRDVSFKNEGDYFSFFIVLNDIAVSHAAYIRLQTLDASETMLALKYVSQYDSISKTVRLLQKNTADFNTLKGKNVVILGDSISTHGNSGIDKNAVEITISAEDVGVQLKAYVTKFDVDAGLTLGGVTYSASDIGTEITFTPTSDDIGKVIGIPKTYYENTMKVWWEWVKEQFDCNMIPVCWSGSGLTRNRQSSDDYKTSYAWHESQIRKCGIRTPGSMDRIGPEVIIITRGGNDWSHSPYAMLTADYFENYNVQYPDTDIRQDGQYGFKEAYFMTIGKLREAYPFAKIVLCTYPVLKRVNYSHFPMNNGYYSEPQYNNAVREIANFCGCDVIEFDKCGITFENMYPTYIDDSATIPVHPNAKGQEVMGKCAIKYLKDFNFDI